MIGERPLGELVRECRLMPHKDRTRWLQGLIGEPTLNTQELHRRALLVTALQEAELWPMRSKQSN
jgi:hypothetical protein